MTAHTGGPDLTATPGQTIGPFFGYALPFDGDSALVPPGSAGAVRLHGRVLDGDGQPVPDALLELWQPDAAGNLVQQPGSLHRDGWTFTGWGRAATDNEGHYSFTTVLPDAPFLALTVFARGLLNRLFTRVYLPGTLLDGEGADPFLRGLEADRRSTLVAGQDETGPMTGLSFDVHLQGDRETVFLSFPRHQP